MRTVLFALLLTVFVAPAARAATGKVTLDCPSISIINVLPSGSAVSSTATVRVKSSSIPDDAVISKVEFTSKKATGGKPRQFGAVISTHAEIKGPKGRWNSKQWGQMNTTVFEASDLDPDPMPAKGTWEVRYRGRNASHNLPGLKTHDRNSLTIHWHTPDEPEE